MELRDFAERILLSDRLEDKLASPGGPLTDECRGGPMRIFEPSRPPELCFSERGAKMPRGQLETPRLRAIAHHIMANHELQALEIMAWVVLAFPDAPADFRHGLAEVMRDEQRHTLMHLRRVRAHGLEFGERPVNGYVWKHLIKSASLLDYLVMLPLTFEGANLDHSLEFAARFAAAEDVQSEQVMRAIHRDEIEHVRFGLCWLRRLKPMGESDWLAYSSRIKAPLNPIDGKGKFFDRESRLEAGMSQEFVAAIERFGV